MKQASNMLPRLPERNRVGRTVVARHKSPIHSCGQSIESRIALQDDYMHGECQTSHRPLLTGTYCECQLQDRRRCPRLVQSLPLSSAPRWQQRNLAYLMLQTKPPLYEYCHYLHNVVFSYCGVWRCAWRLIRYSKVEELRKVEECGGLG